MDLKETRGGYLSLAACICLLIVAPLSSLAQGGLTPILPRMSEHFAADPNAEMLVRMMVSGLSFAMIVGSLGSGFVAERIGQGRLLLLSLAIFAAAGVLGALLESLYLIVASRLLLGIVTAALGVMTATFITTRVAPASRDRWLGFYVVMGTFGGVVVLMLAGLVGKLDWRNVFYLHLAAIPVLLLLRATLPADAQHEVAALREGAVTGRGGFPWALVLFGIVCGAVLTTVMIFFPFHLRGLGLGAPDKVALFMSVSAFTGGVSAFAYGWLRKRLSIVRLFIVGFALAGLGLGGAILTEVEAAILASMMTFGLGVGVIAPNLFAASAAAVPPARRARTIGLVRAGFYAGPLVAQIPLEPIARALGPGAAVAALAVLAFAAIAHAMLIERHFRAVEG